MTLSTDTDFHAETLAWLGRLVAFDTTSRHSNLALIEDVEAYLAERGILSTRVPNADGDKSNLFFSVGPNVAGGVVLSGHTDVVPVDGQDWDTEPFTVTERDGRLYGRGTADMKSFIAIGLAAIPRMQAADLRHPIHFALSYDEEVGLLGAPALITALGDAVPRPDVVIVGEPTDMKIVDRHKGIIGLRTVVTGHEAHSSQTHLGVSANRVAIALMNKLMEMAERLEAAPPVPNGLTPPHTTITIGLIDGGTAPNILARQCSFIWDIRSPSPDEAQCLLDEFQAFADDLARTIRARFDDCGIETETVSNVPPLRAVADSPAIVLATRITGANSCEAASYVAESGQFQQAGYATVVCGPGSIAQAHQPNEYIEVEQLRLGEAFMLKLIGEIAR